jgi:hypothetical protein
MIAVWSSPLRLLGAGLVLLAAMATGQPDARAETPAQRQNVDVARQWGLLGRWRTECKGPLGGGSASLDYAVRDGVLMHERDFGDRQDTQEVLGVRALPDGGLELLIHFPSFNQTRKFVVVRQGARIRAISNSLPDGTQVSIKDGRLTHNGAETPWQSQCNTGPAGNTSGGASPMAR